MQTRKRKIKYRPP